MSNCKEFRIIYANLSHQGGKRMPTLCNIYTPEGNCVYARIYIVIKKIHFLVIQTKNLFMQ